MFVFFLFFPFSWADAPHNAFGSCLLHRGHVLRLFKLGSGVVNSCPAVSVGQLADPRRDPGRPDLVEPPTGGGRCTGWQWRLYLDRGSCKHPNTLCVLRAGLSLASY